MGLFLMVTATGILLGFILNFSSDFVSISKIETLSLFVDTLRQRVGTEIVLENIANDLEVAPKVYFYDTGDVDFVIIEDSVVTNIIEAKLTDTQISKSLSYLGAKLKPQQALQLVSRPHDTQTTDKLRLASALDILSRPEAEILNPQ